MASRLHDQEVEHPHRSLTPEEIEAIRAQLEGMLSDQLFNQSRRYPRLFRHIVENSLAGNLNNLKERVLGIELFERSPDYDTNADAIVRVTASEIRKRIAQYYHEKEHEDELRIDIPVGGYVAEFRLSQTRKELEVTAPVREPATEQHEPPRVVESTYQPRHIKHPIVLLLSACTAVALILVLVFRGYGNRADEVTEFWRPFTSSGSARPLLCVGQLPVSITPQGPKDSLARSLLGQKPVSISDAAVLSEYATYLGTKEIRPRILVSTAATYGDLRQHPVLLIGGLDNNWTIRFLNELRYRMHFDPNSSVLQIYDSSNPSGLIWKMDFSQTTEHVTEDYAIVARFYAPETENTVVVAAGLGENGTATAAEFLLHSQYLMTAGQGAPPQWMKKNMEFVIKTQIIDGNAGPPIIVAQYFW
jgi:hypothetical protein